MKTIWLALLACTLLLVGCGDETDPRISDADALCLKIIQAGGSCNSGSTSTSTATVTEVSTVTITSTTY
jgi:hypothetical protein